VPIFHTLNKKVLFIHIPKTGGTSIEKWLSKDIDHIEFYSKYPTVNMKVTPQHLAKKDLIAFIGNHFDYEFSIVRDPYQRIESEFFYRMGLDKVTDMSTVVDNFSNWVLYNLDELRRNESHSDNHFRRQIEFLDDSVTVFKFEDGLENVIEHLQKEVSFSGGNKRLSKHKASKRLPVRWSRRALYKFNQYYGADFMEFDYPMKRTNVKLIDWFLDSKVFLKLKSLKTMLFGFKC